MTTHTRRERLEFPVRLFRVMILTLDGLQADVVETNDEITVLLEPGNYRLRPGTRRTFAFR